MPTLKQLETALVNADRAGDTDAARKLAAEVQRYRAAGVVDPDPNEGMSRFEKGAVSLGRSFDKTLRGIGEIGLSAAGKVGIGPGAEGMQSESQERDRLWRENATGRMKGGELATDIAQFAIPATGAAKATAGAGMLARAGAQSGAAMGLDAIQQQGEGQEGIDAGRTALVGASAGAAEFIAPVVGRAIQAVQKRYRGGDPLEKGRMIAQEAGFGEIPDEVAIKLAKASDEIEAGAKPESVLAEQEFGFNLTRGQKTGNRKFIDQEDMLRQRDTRAGERINRTDEFNRENLENIVSRETGGLDSAQSAVDDVQAAVVGAKEEAQKGVNKAWEFARNSDLVVSGQLADDFSRNVQNAFQSSGRIVNENIAGSAKSAIDSIDNVLRTAVDESGGIDFKKIEEARKMFSTNYGSMGDPASKAAFRIARQEFDNTLDNLAEATILKGDPEDIQRMKKAIGISRDVFKKFSAAGSKDKIGKTVENILENGNLDDLAAAVLGSGQVAPRAGANFARAVKRTLGENAPELERVKQAVLLKAATRKTGDSLGMKQFSNNLKDLMQNRRDLIGELFTKDEVARLGRMTQALDSMTFKPPGRGQTSGTTERLWRWLDQTAGEGILGIIPRAVRGIREGKMSRAATRPVSLPATAPALPAAAGAATPNRSNNP